jgi:outer membrane autotransporter protein
LRAEAPQFGPITNGSLTQTAFAAADDPLQSINGRFAGLRGDAVAPSTTSANAQSGRYSIWAKGYGATTSQSSRDGFAGYSATTGGFAIGADTSWQQGGAGLALSRSTSTIDENDSLSGDNALINSYQVSAYATQGFGPAYVEGLVAVAQQKFDTTRTVLNGVASGSYNGTQAIFKLSGGYQIPIATSAVLTPIVSLQANTLHQDGYSETGANALDLNVDSQNSSRVRFSLGARLSGQPASNIQPEVHVFVNQDVGGESDGVGASFAGGGATFVTPSYDVPRTSFTVGGGLNYAITKMVSLQLQADVQAATGYTEFAGGIVARGQF